MSRVDAVGPRIGADVAAYYGLPGLVDLRDRLAWRDDRGPDRSLPLGDKRGVIVHYAGDPQDLARSDRDLLALYASWHTIVNWGSAAWPVYGNGIMYHLGIGRDGTVYLLRSIEREAWHCGVPKLNRTALAVIVPIGGDQIPTLEAVRALWRVADWWIATGHGSREDVRGHGEVYPTSCPGRVMDAFVRPYRAGDQLVENEVMRDDVTGHVIGHGFMRYWRDKGGLLVFGHPLTDEFDIVDPDAPGGRRTVQVFERYVMEFHPENPPGWRVVGRRIGAEVLDALLAQRVR